MSRSAVAFEQSTTLVVVVELSQKSWLVAASYLASSVNQ